jgi:uncharacterized protein
LEEMTAESVTLRPTPRGERIGLIDITRGAALFGVLVINTVYIAGFTVPQSDFPGGVDQVIRDLLGLFVNLRFLGLFSILFGLGFILQIRRAKEKGARFRARYLRRIAILFIVGLIHSLFYPGDILKAYAVLGLLLPLVYRLSPRTLATLSLLCVLLSGVGPAITRASPALSHRLSPQTQSLFERSDFCRNAASQYPSRTEAYAEGSLTQVLSLNACGIPEKGRGFLRDWTLAHIFGLFLIGVLIGTTDFIRSIPDRIPQILVGTLICGFVGFALLGIQIWVPNVNRGWLLAFADTTMGFGYYLTTLAYGGGIILIHQTGLGGRALRPLSAVGRTALTVYLLQSVVYSTMFLGYGLGWDIRMGLPSILGITVVIYLAEVVVCNLWMKYFRFGPAEWVWRSLTYLKVQPLLNRGTQGRAGAI